jgi:3-deoxy-D-manno-octulosonic-acid transferase
MSPPRRRAPLWYEIGWRIALPLALFRLWWRGRKEPGYRQHIPERLGRYAREADRRPLIWIHAVSVGETRAAQPLVAGLLAAPPAHRLLLTPMTAAGRETGRALFGGKVAQVYLPYDASFAVDRFLAAFRPRFGLLLETEIWPNLVLRAAARGVPLFLVNARLSQRSADRYARMPKLTRATLAALAGISAQNGADAQRFAALGARDVTVAGNVKFDIDAPPGNRDRADRLREWLGTERPVWVAGSTRDGEEALLLAALRRSPLPPQALLVLVPRHPQRFGEVAALLEQHRIVYARRSAAKPVLREVEVVLGDSMGEMFAYYAAADVAFVGGTLQPLGGQNLIEPLAVGTPVVVGPSTFNFAEVARAAVAAGAALQVENADDVVARIRDLLSDGKRRRQMADAGRELLAAHRGATGRILQWIAARLGENATDVAPSATPIGKAPG